MQRTNLHTSGFSDFEREKKSVIYLQASQTHPKYRVLYLGSHGRMANFGVPKKKVHNITDSHKNK